jgi:hypothetical protein
MQTGFWGARVHGVVLATGARLLHDYERFIYTPGPATAVAIVLGIAGIVVGRRRRDGGVIALLLVTGLLLLIVPIMTVDLDYRYVLSTQELIVAGGVLGVVSIRDSARVRGRASTLTRRPIVVAAGVLTVAGLCVSNAMASQAYGDGGLNPQATTPIGSTNDISDRLQVQASDEQLAGYACVKHHIAWRLRFSLSASWLHGPPLLVAGDDLYVAHGDAPVWPTIPISRARGLLRPVLVSHSYRRTAGTFQFTVDRPSGTLVYVDPLGAGATAWRFGPPPNAVGVPATGSSCVAPRRFTPVPG